MPSRPSLKVRGIQYLAQREHSRSELRTKLLRHARADAQAAAQAAAEAAAPVLDDRGGAADLPPASTDAPEARRSSAAASRRARPAPPGDAFDPHPDDTPEAQVDRTLDWLQAQRYLDEARFVDSRVHARSARYGNLRIRQELAQHGVALTPDATAALKASELDRARAVWQRKFGSPAVDAAERARQMRFLAGRGFSTDVIRRVVAGDDEP